jgi:glycosyltransferase involved in cell wall biosynthesis
MTSPSLPLVSVVISVYNGMPFILQTLDSVRRQTYPHWELIICDNASTDDTVASLERYMREKEDSRIRLLHQKHISVAQDWNRSLEHAQGEYVKLLGCDDILLPTCLETQVKLLQEHSDVGFVSSGKEVIDTQGVKYMERRPLKEGKYDWASLGHKLIYAVVNLIGEPAGVLFRKELLTSCGFYDSNYRYFIDVEFLIRLLRKSNLYITEQPLYQFRTHGQTLTATTRSSSVQEYVQILNLYESELDLARRPFLKAYLKGKAQLVTWARSLATQNIIHRFSAS